MRVTLHEWRPYMRGDHEVVGGGLAMARLYQLHSHMTQQLVEWRKGEDVIDRSMGVVCQR